MSTQFPRLLAAAALAAFVLFVTAFAHAQQTYISRFDVYTGFTDIENPALGLSEHNGFHVQAGMNPRRWLSFGGDYSEASGSEMLTTDLLPAATQAKVNAAQAKYIALGLLPANYHLAVPTDAGPRPSPSARNSLTGTSPKRHCFCVRRSVPSASAPSPIPPTPSRRSSSRGSLPPGSNATGLVFTASAVALTSRSASTSVYAPRWTSSITTPSTTFSPTVAGPSATLSAPASTSAAT